MAEFANFKIEIFIPEEFVIPLRDALNEAGAGHIGNYDHCISVYTVRGYWRALPGADPYAGEVGKLFEGSECKVEVNCKREHVAAAIQAIRKVHPYEEPVINVIPLANDWFE